LERETGEAAPSTLAAAMGRLISKMDGFWEDMTKVWGKT